MAEDRERREWNLRKEWAEAVGANLDDLDDWVVHRILDLEDKLQLQFDFADDQL